MEKESFIMLMAECTKVRGKMTKSMGMVQSKELIFTKDNGIEAQNMETDT